MSVSSFHRNSGLVHGRCQWLDAPVGAARHVGFISSERECSGVLITAQTDRTCGISLTQIAREIAHLSARPARLLRRMSTQPNSAAHDSLAILMRGLKRIFILAVIVNPLLAQQKIVSDPPEVREPFTLTAVYDREAGHNAFLYAGKTVPPVIRTQPGGIIKLVYANDLPVYSREECAAGPCMDMSNLHFHGLHVSPERPQDDVLTMMTAPGQKLNYQVDIPSDAPPGLYWYHTHPHGESARQDLDGMSGAIVIDGIDRYYPEVRQLRERVLVLRDRDLEHHDGSAHNRILQQVGVPGARCGTATDQKVERIFTVNDETRPQIPINPGERQFWRIVNASPDRYADLKVDGQQLEIIALDGMPLSYHDPGRGTHKVDHVLVSPAGRVEAIVAGPPAGTHSTLSTLCVDTGPLGDDNAAMVIADLTSAAKADSEAHNVPVTTGPAVYKEIHLQELQGLETSTPNFTVIFTEDQNGFYINGKKFSMDSPPMLHVKVGSMQHWHIVNATGEVHPFHIHQVHFLAYATNGVRVTTSEWLDTVNVPYRGTVDLIMDFTDPVIRGMSLFHCHILSHEDKGMMAKILFE
jgi:suppressor of ftsI